MSLVYIPFFFFAAYTDQAFKRESTAGHALSKLICANAEVSNGKAACIVIFRWKLVTAYHNHRVITDHPMSAYLPILLPGHPWLVAAEIECIGLYPATDSSSHPGREFVLAVCGTTL